jgi:hypothetical protein
MEEFKYPEWPATSGESYVSDRKEFKECEAAIQILASRSNSNIADRRYTYSNQWGRILRAKILTGEHGLSVVSRVTCWMGPDKGVQLAVEVEGCGPQQAGC